MKIVVLGGTGLIGAKLVSLLRSEGHEVIAASPSLGINSITGRRFDRGINRSASGRGCYERSFLGRQCRAGILRNFDPQSPRRGEENWRRPPHCTLYSWLRSASC